LERDKVLVVDDEAMVREVMGKYLERDGFAVRLVADGAEALRVAGEWWPDLVLLDLMLPRLDGLEVCRRLQASRPVPVIMLTAKGQETDKLVGLGLGADDYVTKPFSPREVVARVKAVLRRARQPALTGEGDSLRFGELTVNPRGRQVLVGERTVDLTAREFDLLHFLCRHHGQVFTREQLLDRVWDYSFYGDTSTVTVHIRRLREKVEPDPERPRWIKTVWGVGYKFEAALTPAHSQRERGALSSPSGRGPG